MSTAPWTGPEWDDPTLTQLARQLRDAHRAVAPLPPQDRRRLIRHLLAITDLAKRDAELAARRLDAFLADFQDGPDVG
ncbi:hypothetical protein [Actinomadura sp. WMMA1423]|uniref:hypothetical protein n=1 Tax=Actinomadura sp. WMMA1423 TaxID=2591108 RepID=UPI001147A0DF|nr:hypothetical protein [Actinomadura sp. WMMA1423]